MNTRNKSLVLAAVISIMTSLAGAQATRTWVSGVGDDANPCSRTAPCKTFAGAISKTAAQGEINVIDPGAYGAVTITKSITIDGGGMFASSLATLNTNGIIVNAGVNDVVVLRNLSIIGATTGLNGIRFLAGAKLQVENCRIHGWAGHGIDVFRTAGGDLTVRNTIISRCAVSGINVFTSGGSAFASISNVQVNGCNTGVRGGNGSRLLLRGCDISLNTNGLVVQHGALPSRAEVDSCTFVYLGTALQSGPGASSQIRMTNNTIHNNTIALSGSGGTFSTAGNNSLMGNTSDGVAATLVLPQ